ncbi:prealbumin-like fold domain-containing protein [Janibacter sp. G56]|uniref:prealbumin-like fold domain-containing protein n=1 Tax=Janibacter sp. G56 TaxID=3418717 RepID=UPI003CFD9BCB
MCFGSAYLKSRSSDSFTAAAKDFIEPIPTGISNCGKVIIRKVTDPTGATGTWDFTPDFTIDPGVAVGDPGPAAAFALGDGDDKQFTNVLIGDDLTVTETEGNGYDLTDIDCSASEGVEPTTDLATGRASFDIDDPSDVVDCTFTNTARGTIVIQKVITDGFKAAPDSQAFAFTSTKLGPFQLTPTGTGAAGLASTSFTDQAPGGYAVAETVPTSWDLTGTACTSTEAGDASTVGAIDLDPGETVTCTFTNAVEKGGLLITKLRKHQASGSGWHPQSGVDFTTTGGSTPEAGVASTTGDAGTVCIPGLQVSAWAGDYTVAETVPDGYHAVDADGNAITDLTQTVAVTDADCGSDGVTEVTFHNMPLTDVSVSVDSQVPGGTASTMACVEGTDPTADAIAEGATSTEAGAGQGDGSITADDLLPGTYTCTVVVDP